MSWLHYLPPKYLTPIQNLPPGMASRITEARFRLNKPFSVTVDGRNLMPDTEGFPCLTDKAIFVTEEDLKSLLTRLTEGSLYAFESCMAEGFIPLEGGCRAGLAGDAVETEQGMVFRRITSVNLRVSRFLPEFARSLIHLLEESPKSVLVVSPPAGGKTTFLRSAAYLLATGNHPKRVGIADERGELDIPGGLCDRITGCPKWKAIELLTRTMSPEYLVCDELGAGEALPLLAAQNTGVKLLASAHGGTPAEALRRPCVKPLWDGGVFDLLTVLTKPYRIRIYTREELETCVC